MKANAIVAIFTQNSIEYLWISIAMSEKLCLQSNNFNESVTSAFVRLRDDKEFADVTLACEDGQQMEAYKIFLASSSTGFHLQDLASILDFLFFGKANVYQENLESFLAVAEELKLEGLVGQSSADLLRELEKHVKPEIVEQNRESLKRTTTCRDNVINDKVTNAKTEDKISRSLDIPNKFSGDLQALDKMVKSMMEKSLNLIPAGKQPNGSARHKSALICKVCGKEGELKSIRYHIEANHVEGISIPCRFCEKVFCSRQTLRKHKNRFHIFM